VSILLLLVLLAVLGVITLVAAGRGDTLPDASPDRSPHGALPEGPIAREDVDRLRFSLGFRGYRMDEVDQVLDRLLTELEARDRRIAELEGRPETQQPPAGGEAWPSS
jgi:DivIVA domain-containing protein